MTRIAVSLLQHWKNHRGCFCPYTAGCPVSGRPLKKVEVLEYPELDMEAIWRIEVEDFPAFIVVNHEGKDFYAELATQRPQPLVQIRTGH